jgi:hypothetical protein
MPRDLLELSDRSAKLPFSGGEPPNSLLLACRPAPRVVLLLSGCLPAGVAHVAATLPELLACDFWMRATASQRR